MQLHQFLFRPSHKMLVILSNCKEKRLPFPLLERATSCAYGFSPAPAPRTLHPGTSFARWTSSTVLCPLAAVHFALRSRQTLCPFENNLFHRTYLCRSRLAEAEGRSFLRSAAAIPAGVFAPCSAGSARISLAHGRILSKLRFGFSAPPVFPCANRLCFLGSVPSLGFGGARFARFRFSILDVPFGLFPCSHPAALFPMGFASMRPLRPKLPPSWGSMQISDLWGLRFETHSHFRILAGFGIALCRLSGLGAIPLAAGGRRIRAYPFSSGVHRFLAPLRPCPLFLPLPAEILRFAFRKKQVYGKRVPVVFCLVFQGPPPRLCRHCARGSDLSAMPVSFNCRVLPIFWMLRPARFPGLCPCASAHPGLAGRVPISGFPLDRSCSQPRFLLGLPPAVFSPSDDFFELPLSRSLMQPLCCIRIKHTLSRLLRGQFPEAVGTLPLAISAFSPFAIGSAPFPFSCLYYSMPFAVCQQESFCVYLLCVYNYLRTLSASKFP